MANPIPWDSGDRGIEEVISVSWTRGDLVAIIDLVSHHQAGDYDGPQILKCSGVEYLKVTEEAVSDRSDMYDTSGHQKVFKGLHGFTFADGSPFLERMKTGENYGEYVSHKSKHYVVRAPYNCFEFISCKSPSLGGYDAH